MESRNAKGVKWFDILNMYSKNELINWYNENTVKTKSINFKTIYKRKIKLNILKKYLNILMKQQKKILLNGC